MAGQGVQNLPIRYPREAPPWFVDWFSAFIRDVLANLDVRNSTEGLGISIEGTPDGPATISSSEDLQALFDANLILAEAEALLPNARTLAGESGVVDVSDSGAGGQVTIGITQNGLQFSKIQQVTPLSVLANPEATAANINRIASTANDTILRRVADVLEFGQLTVGMAADGLWTYAKLASAVQASLDLADSAVQTGDSPSFATVDTDGYTVATLPAGSAGMRAYVTDATAPTFLATLVGGGAVVCPAFHDGTNWVAG